MARLEKIVEQGYDYLNWYHDYKSPPKSKNDDIIVRPCTYPDCTTNVIINKGETLCNKHRSHPEIPIEDQSIEEEPIVTTLSEESKEVVVQELQPVVVKSIEEIKTSKEVQLSGLNARQIIDLVKELTGQEITICIKSKINIIRHAKVHLEMAGYKII